MKKRRKVKENSYSIQEDPEMGFVFSYKKTLKFVKSVCHGYH